MFKKKINSNNSYKMMIENGCIYNARVKENKMRQYRSMKDSVSYWGIRTFLFFSLLSICSFIMLTAGFYFFFSYKDITMAEVTEIKGTIGQYYLYGSKSKILDLRLREYSQDFTISVQALDYNKFQANESDRNPIRLLISNEDFKNLKNRNFASIEVRGIITDNKNYLDIESYNDYKKFQARCAFLVGIMGFLFEIVFIRLLILF